LRRLLIRLRARSCSRAFRSWTVAFTYTAAGYNLLRLPKLIGMARAFLRLSEWWRIAEMDEWEHRDLLEPAHIVFTGSGGELVFAGVEADVRPGSRRGVTSAALTWRV
jgi:hypothetical protein